MSRDTITDVLNATAEYTMWLRLEVAKAAEKTGLLWFDVHEGRWRI